MSEANSLQPSPDPLPDPAPGDARELADDRPTVRDDAAGGSQPEGPPELDGYEVAGVLGRGGMGVVYRAWQRALKRPVAVKVMGGGASAERRARFRSEYELLARLRHPNVVQIYEVGEAGGRPYFVMELVEGGSLDRRLGGAPQPARRAAELVAVLARTVEAAHRLGVIHRDLKPANVLLQVQDAAVGPPDPASCVLQSARCIPKIADFGLAKRLAPGPDDPSPGGPTHSGAVLGTPSYMAPEQAGGAREAGAAADVYSLGAILYELLTGRPPFRAATVLQTLEQVRSQEPVPPRRLQPGLPRDLETICLRCLQKEPGRRYPGAGALADDLDRFLRGEPIRARPVSSLEHAWKWARRRPATASLAASLAAALLGLVALGAWSYANIRRALDDVRAAGVEKDRQAEQARNEADRALRASRAASRRYAIARFAVDRFYTHVCEDRLLNQREMAGLRNELLRGAVEFYEGFAREAGEDRETQVERARAHMRHATLTAQLTSFPEALKLARKGLALFAALAEKYPDRAEYRHDLARAHSQVGDFLTRTNRPDDAEAAYRRALALQEALPATGEYQDNLASTHHNLGLLYEETNRIADAERAFRRAADIRRRLVREHPDAARYRQSLALTLNELGTLFLIARRGDRAEAPCREALALYEQLLAAEPNNLAYQIDAARSRLSMGGLHYGAGRLEEAERAFRPAVTLFDRLAREHPTVADFQQGLIAARVNLAAVLGDRGHKDKAAAALRIAVEAATRLHASHPSVQEYTHALAAAHGNLAVILRETDQLPDALREGGRAVGLWEGVLSAAKGRDPVARGGLVNGLRDRALTLDELGRHAEALKDWDRAVALAHPTLRDSLRVRRACTLARSGRHGRAVAEAEELARLAGLPPPDVGNLGCVYSLCIEALHKDGRVAADERRRLETDYGTRAVELLSRAHRAGFFRKPDQRSFLRTSADLNRVRSRPDFQKLLAALEADGTGQ